MSRTRDPVGSFDGATPKAAVGRVSLYLRQLETLHRDGKTTVSSNQLGTALEITDAQVRKDLAYFGQFGYPGIGYRVGELRDALRTILGTDRTWPVALIGIGNLGRALLGYGGFDERGFSIVALFDRDRRLIGQRVQGMEVHSLERLPSLAGSLRLRLAALAVPAVAAQQVADVAVESGIEGILNFAPVRLKVPEEVPVASVDLGLQFEQLAFQVHQRRSDADRRNSR